MKSALGLILTVNTAKGPETTLYVLSKPPFDRETVRNAWRLQKPDGTVYDVIQTVAGEWTCDCRDSLHRHDDGSCCKHVWAILEQQRENLL
jgi:hypothetical protein